MHKKMVSLLKIIPSIALAVTLPVSIAYAVPMYCAETITSTSIYSLEADSAGGAITSSMLWNGGSDLGGIATYGKYAFVTDNTSTKSYLRVFDLASKRQIGDGIEIGVKGESGVQAAGQVSVDSSGNVYVIDASKRNSSAKFAMIVNWENPSSAIVNYASVSGYSYIDVAGLGASDASILLQSNTSSKQISFVTWNGTSTNPTRYEIDNASSPVAIAANKTTNNSYVLSMASTLVEGNVVTSTSLRTLLPGTANVAVTSIAGLGQDVAMISDGTVDYAAVLGTNGGDLQITRVGLAAGVANGAQNALKIADGDINPVHFAQSSQDGKMLWVTAQGTGKVYGVSSLTWTESAISAITIGDRIGSIATHSYYTTVPEPSSLITLLSMGAGVLGILRRKK